MTKNNELEQYKSHVEETLSKLSPYLQRYALGDFSETIEIPEEENEFTELRVGLTLMVDDIKEMMREKEGSIRELKMVQENLTVLNEELTQRKQFTDAILDTSPETIYVYDIIEKKNVFVNEGIKKSLGYSEQEIIDFGEELIPKLMHPDDFKIYLEETIPRYGTANDGEIIEHQYRMKHKDGDWRWLHCKEAIFARLPGGEPKQIFGIIMDITERRKGDLALQLSEERFKLATDASDNGIWDWDVLTGEVYFSPNWKRQLGYEDHELENAFSTWENHLHPDDSERAHRILEEYLKDPTGYYELDFRLRHKDGSYRWIYNRAASLLDDEGNVIRMFGAHMDLTERKLAEEELRSSEEKVTSFLDNTQDLITVVDTQGKLTYANHASKMIFGLEPEDAIGRVAFDFIHEDDKERTSEAFQGWLAEKVESVIFENRQVSMDGTVRDILWTILLKYSKDGDPESFWSIARDITEQNEAELRILRERDFSDAVINNLPGIFYMFDAEGKMHRWNDRFEEVSGYTHEEIQGTTALDYISESFKERTQTEIKRAFSEGRSTVDSEFRTKDGRTMPYFFTGGRLVIDGTAYLVGMGTDITDRKLSEERLRKSEEKFQDLYNNAPDMFCSVDPGSGNIIECNETLCEMTGFTRDEIIGHHVFDRYHESSLEAAKENFMMFVKTGIVKDAALRLRKKDGDLIDVSLNVTAVRDSDGNILHSRSIWRDITIQRRAEEELRLKNIAFESSIEANSIADVNGIITHCNPAFLKMWGYASTEEAIGNSVGDFFANPEDAGPVLESLATKGSWQGEFPGKRQDGSTFITQGYATDVRDATGKHIAYQSTNIDMTMVHEANERLEQTMEDLEKSNRELEQFAYVASHDLQEPLRKVKSFTELLAQRMDGKLDEKETKYVNYIVSGSSRMQGLLNDLLTFSRVTTRGKPFETVHCDDVLAKTLDNINSMIQESNARITSDPLPFVFGDRTQLNQVFQNLITNGIKFHGESDPTIHIRANEKEDEWEFSVRDNGIGIDPDQFDRIFQIFQRLHPRGVYPGSGIGLAIVKKIVERHGGRLRVESEPGKGSTFMFTIPVRATNVKHENEGDDDHEE